VKNVAEKGIKEYKTVGYAYISKLRMRGAILPILLAP
jgi:hypothetical protein